MAWMGVPAALNNRLWARLRARNAVSSFMVFSKSARCSSLKGCTYLMIITSSGRGEYATQSGLTLMRYCISIVSKNFWSGTYVVLQLAGRIQMVRLVDAAIQQIDTPLRCPLLDVSGGGNFGGVQLQLPQADHHQPFEGTQLALLKDRTGPVREPGQLLAQARGAV